MKPSIPQVIDVLGVLEPAADGAGRTSGVFFNMKGYLKAWLVFWTNQGNAATIQIDPKQANTNSGGGAKALPAMQIHVTQDAQTSPVSWTRATAAANFTTDAALKKKIVIFEIDLVQMDTDNGFHYLGVTTGASNAANITSALILAERKYQGETGPDPLA